MDAKQWNETHAVGTRVQVTLANGNVITGRTLGPAQRWGGLDHVQVTGISGFVLVSWVAAVAGAAPDEAAAVPIAHVPSDAAQAGRAVG